MTDGPHQSQPMLQAGATLADAQAAVVMTHGRGDNARSFINLANAFYQENVAYIALQAAGNSWYPYGFMSPMEQNQPGLDSGLQRIGEAVALIEEAGLMADKILLMGFSQGACLTLEFVARNARRYGGVAGLSGGLIGPEGTPREYDGHLAGTPVFLGCSDVDFHIPKERVHESARVLAALGAEVDERIYPQMGHTINEEEYGVVAQLLSDLTA